MTDLCATNKAHDNQMTHYGNMSIAKRTKPVEDDKVSVGTSYSTKTAKTSNTTMSSRVMTRGEAWNVIKQRNWVQQTIIG